MLVCGKDLIHRVADFEQRTQTLSLRPWQWEFLLAMDGRTQLADVARRVGIDMAIASETVHFFHEQNLIAIRTVHLEEYRRPNAESEAVPMPERPMEFAQAEQAEAFVPPVPASIAFPLKPPVPSVDLPSPLAPSSQGPIGFKIK